jgi:hypothetical protein
MINGGRTHLSTSPHQQDHEVLLEY